MTRLILAILAAVALLWWHRRKPEAVAPYVEGDDGVLPVDPYLGALA